MLISGKILFRGDMMKTKCFDNNVGIKYFILLFIIILSIFGCQEVYAKQGIISNNDIVGIGNNFLKILYKDEEIKKNEKYSIDMNVIPIYDINDTKIGYSLSIENKNNEEIGTMILLYYKGNLTLSESSIDESISRNYKVFSEQNNAKEIRNGNNVVDNKLVKIGVLEYVDKQQVEGKDKTKAYKYYDLRKNKQVPLDIQKLKEDSKKPITSSLVENKNSNISSLAAIPSIYGENRLRMDFYFDGNYYGGEQ